MYSLSFTGFFKQYRINNIWSPLGIKPRNEKGNEVQKERREEGSTEGRKGGKKERKEGRKVNVRLQN